LFFGIAFTQFKHDVTKAMEAKVTEFGFFSLPDAKANEAVVMKDIIGEANIDEHPVITVGKAKGAAMGFVWAVKPDLSEQGSALVFTGVFGYDSVEDHWKWRDTPEHAGVIEGMEKLVKEYGLKAVDVLGKRRAMFEGSGIVHVKFEKLPGL
jgi:hypothetical protein